MTGDDIAVFEESCYHGSVEATLQLIMPGWCMQDIGKSLLESMCMVGITEDQLPGTQRLPEFMGGEW
jgi:hypothetical protein